MDVLNRIPPDARVVVEIGCGDGALGAHLCRINPAAHYYGIEPNADRAQLAQQHLHRVAKGNAEEVEIDTLGLEPGKVDCLVYNGALECMRDPWGAVRKHASWLRDGGQVVACIANVQHWSTFLHLVTGDWRYDQPGGFLKRDQLRYFSLDTMKELFTSAGLRVFHTLPRLLESQQFRPFRLALSPILQALKVNEDEFDDRLHALQFVVRAVKTPQPPRAVFLFTCVLEPMVAAVRVWEPERCLNTIPGVRAGSLVKSADLGLERPEEAKIYVWQRVILVRGPSLTMHQELLRRGYLTVAEYDDDPDHFPDIGANDYLTLSGCHCVQTSTEALATELRRHNPHVQVFPNQLAALPPPRTYKPDGPLTLFFGALNRQADWKPLMPALNRVLATQGDRVHVRVIWDQEFFRALETPHKTFEDWCAYERYQEILHGCDIALLPLNATRFNSLKSDVKFIECAGHGVTVLASPTVYAGSLRSEETGLLFETPAQFEAQLQRLLNDGELRLALANNAYQYVAQTRLQVHHYRKRYEWYCQMLDQLPRLTADLRQRVPELFE